MHLDWAVQRVQYGTHGVKLHSSDGLIVTADYAILAVPVVTHIFRTSSFTNSIYVGHFGFKCQLYFVPSDLAADLTCRLI